MAELFFLNDDVHNQKIKSVIIFWAKILLFGGSKFLQVPEREHHRNRQIRLRPIRRAAIQPAPIHLNESLVVEVIDEIENVPVNTQISPVMPPDEESNPVEIITCDQNQQPVDVV